MMIDTHTHLYLKDFAADIDAVIMRAKDEGVEKFYLPAIGHHKYFVMNYKNLSQKRCT